MKLHLPKGLRSAVMACMAVTAGFATTVGTGIITGGAVSYVMAGASLQAAEYALTDGRYLVDGDIITSIANINVNQTVITMDDNTMTDSIVVGSGITLKQTKNDHMGVNYIDNQSRMITVQNGGILDVSGKEAYYHVILENGATLTNSGDDVSTGNRSLPIIDLKGNATVSAVKEGETDWQFGMLGGGYNTSYLNLNGHTLTKAGAGTFHLSNTNVAPGVIHVAKGTLLLHIQEGKEGVLQEGTEITVSEGATAKADIYSGTLKIQGTKFDGDITYYGNGSTIRFESGTSTVGAIAAMTNWSDYYNRHLLVDSAATVTATKFANSWGFGTMTVNGELNFTESFNYTTGPNDSTDNNIINGSGIINVGSAEKAGTLKMANHGTYNLSVAQLNVYGEWVHELNQKTNVNGGHITVTGDTNMKSGTLSTTGGVVTLKGGLNVTGGTATFGGELELAAGSSIAQTGGALSLAAVNVTADSAAVTGTVAGVGFHKLGAGTLDVSQATLNLSGPVHMNYEGSITMGTVNLANGSELVYGTDGDKMLNFAVANGITQLGLNMSAVDSATLAAGIDLGLTYNGNVNDLATILGVNAANLKLESGTYHFSWSVSDAVAATWDKNWGYNGLTGAPTSLGDGVSITDATSDGKGLCETGYLVNNQVIVKLIDNKLTSASGLGSADEPMAIVGGAYHAKQTAGGTINVTGGVWIQATAGAYGAIAGGNMAGNWGNATRSEFIGDTHIVVDGAYARDVLGANFGNGDGNGATGFTGDTYVSVYTDTIGASVGGGSITFHGGASTVTGDTNVFVYTALSNVNESKFRGEDYTIAGGMLGGDNNSPVLTHKGNASVLIDLSSYEGTDDMEKRIIGGSLAKGTLNMTGKSTLTILGKDKSGKDVTFSDVVVGGVYTRGASLANISDVKLTIDGGKYTTVVAGGAYSVSDKTTSVGDVVVDLKGGTLSSLYAGGYQGGNGAISVASTTVNVYDSLSVTNTTTISGGFGYADGKSGSAVAGDRVLNFVAETATVGTDPLTWDFSAASVKDFDIINVSSADMSVKLGSFFNSSVSKTGAGVLELSKGGLEGGLSLVNVLTVEEGTLALTDTANAYVTAGIQVEAGAKLDIGSGAALQSAFGVSTLTLDEGAILAATREGTGLNVGSLTIDTAFALELDEPIKNGDCITLVTGFTDISGISGITFENDIASIDCLSSIKVGNQGIDDEVKKRLQLEYIDGSLCLTTIAGTDLTWGGQDGNWSNDAGDDEWYDAAWEEEPPSMVGYTPNADSVTFDETGVKDDDTATVTITEAVVTGDMTVKNGKYTFTQGTAADGTTPVCSLKVEDTLLIGENGHAVLDMAVEAKTIKLTDSTSSITVNQKISITEGGGWNASNGGTITNGLTNDSVVLSNSSLGGVATKSGNTINGNGLTLVGGHFSIVDSTLTGQINNSDCSGVQLGGTIVLDTRAMGALIEGHFISYYDQTGATPTGENNGYTKESMHAKLFTDSRVQQADAPDKPFEWEMIDALENRLTAFVTPTDDTLTTYAISSGSASEEYVAGDATKAAVYDATKALFSERATALVLYGGNIVLQTGLDKSEGTKLTGGIRAEQDGTVTITDGVTLSRADVNPNGHIISLDGAGTYDVISGTALIGKDGSIGTVKLADAWTGTVKTGALTGTDIDVSALGNANSTVHATSISATKLTAGTVGNLVVDGVTTLSGAGSTVNGLTTKKLLTLGKGADLTASGALDLGGGVEYQALDAATKITADSLTNTSLSVTIAQSLLKETADATTDKTQPIATLMTVTSGSAAEISLNGGPNVQNVYGEKYGYKLDWAPSASPDAPTGTDLQLTAQANPNYVKQRNAGGTPNGMAGATIMDDAFVNNRIGTTGDLAAIMAAVDAGAITDKDLAAVAGSSTATLGMALAGDVERQLRAIRNRTTTMGVDQCVMHDDMPYVNAWVNAEGNLSELDQDGTYAGYSLDSWGGTVGFDVDVTPRLTLGMAVTAMYGDLTVDGPDMLEGDMDTYYLSAFARYSYRAWSHTFVGTVGMMDGSYERTVNHAGGSYKTEGDTEGMAFALMYEVGRVYAFHEDSSACWQPVFNVAYRHTAVDGYKEKGGVALNVDDQTLDTITFGAGARMQAIVGENLYNRTSVLELRALAKLDVGDRSSEADVAFAAGGRAATVESAELGAFGVELGAGLSIPMGDEDSGSLFFDVSAELRSGYSNVNGTVGYRINF